MKEYRIGPNEAGQRLDKFLRKLLPEAGSSFLYRMMRKKNITLNGGKCAGSEKLLEGDVVRVWFSGETIAKFTGQSGNGAARKSSEAPVRHLSALPGKQGYHARTPVPASSRKAFRSRILYEDADILIFDKPAGLLSQKADPSDLSANDLLLSYLLESGALRETDLRAFRPSFANRLDRNTSGLLLAGKSLSGLQALSEHLRDRSIQKFYLCGVSGIVNSPAEIRGYLRKDARTNRVAVSEQPKGKEDREIRTFYRPLQTAEERTLLQIHLITGRTHQIRAHLASAGHPVLGDPKYGDASLNRELFRQYRLNRQLLHAFLLKFPETREKPLAALSGKTVTAPVPPEFLLLFPGFRPSSLSEEGAGKPEDSEKLQSAEKTEDAGKAVNTGRPENAGKPNDSGKPV